MIDLQLLETIEKLELQEQLDNEEQEVVNQVFPAHETLNDRFCKTFYYGRLPATDRTSLPLTQLAVDRFTGVGLDALGSKLGRLDIGRAADISRNACASPTSLVLALLYLDRLRRNNPDYLNTITSTDLFLVSLLVANKFLHDDGEEDEVFNDEWANSGGIDTKELNQLELGFLSAIDWRIYVANDEFAAAVKRVESDIAFKQVSARGFASYSDLTQLTNTATLQKVWSLLSDCTIKVTAVCLTAYAASILTLLGTVSFISTTPLAPTHVSSSARSLASSVRTSVASLTSSGDSGGPEEALDGIADMPLGLDDLESDFLLDIRPSAAEFLTASLLVATLTSGGPVADDLDMQDYSEYGGRSGGGRRNSSKKNRSKGVDENGDEDPDTNLQEEHSRRANWLSSYSSIEDDTASDTNTTDWSNIPPDINGMDNHDGVDIHDDMDNQTHVPPWLRRQEEFIRHATTTEITEERTITSGRGYMPTLTDNRYMHNTMDGPRMEGLTDGILETLAKQWEAEAKEDLYGGSHCLVPKWRGWFGETNAMGMVLS